MSKISIKDLSLEGKRVFIRVDFNVPLEGGAGDSPARIASDKRIRASLPTIRYALDHGAALVLASHLGRPKGKPNPQMSLKPVARRLEEQQDAAGRGQRGLVGWREHPGSFFSSSGC